MKRLPWESDAVAALVGHRLEGSVGSDPAGVERRIDVDQLEALVLEAGQHLQVVCQDDLAGAKNVGNLRDESADAPEPPGDPGEHPAPRSVCDGGAHRPQPSRTKRRSPGLPIWPRPVRPSRARCQGNRSRSYTPKRIYRRESGVQRSDRPPRGVPVHARGVRVDVPRETVDDAPVRGVRDERGDQRALPLPARARADRALDRVRHALADGPRLRRPAQPREVGREGVAVDTVEDMRTLFGGDRPRRGLGVDDDQRAGGDHARLLRGRGGVRPGRPRPAAEHLAGTIQADILKEYIAQKEWCFPIDPAMRLCGDMIEWCTRKMPRWHPISISGYHIREAGATAQQELAFTLADGLTYVRQAVERGPRRRRVRAAAVVLLQRPDRPLRGDRQVPRGAADLGAGDARDVRREEPALVADALPRTDRGRQR